MKLKKNNKKTKQEVVDIIITWLSIGNKGDKNPKSNILPSENEGSTFRKELTYPFLFNMLYEIATN